MGTLITIIFILTFFLSCTKEEIEECWVCKTTSPDIPWFYKQETVDVTYCNLTLEEIVNIEKAGTFTSEVNIPVEYTKGNNTLATKRPCVIFHTITKCNKK